MKEACCRSSPGEIAEARNTKAKVGGEHEASKALKASMEDMPLGRHTIIAPDQVPKAFTFSLLLRKGIYAASELNQGGP